MKVLTLQTKLILYEQIQNAFLHIKYQYLGKLKIQNQYLSLYLYYCSINKFETEFDL